MNLPFLDNGDFKRDYLSVDIIIRKKNLLSIKLDFDLCVMCVCVFKNKLTINEIGLTWVCIIAFIINRIG